MIKITQNSKCSGCYSCVNACPKSCISMVSDAEGFWYPRVEEPACINCGKCEKVCPVVHNKASENISSAYAAYNKNEKIRQDSSSGGLFTLFAEYIINSGGVVFGACFNDTFEVVHDYTERVEGLVKFRGSKYLQSKIGDTYKATKDLLDNNRPVLYTGTPCQIAGLRAYLGREYDNLYCQDIICHGVPSPKVWSKYLEHREMTANASAGNVSFRDKSESWKRYSVAIKFDDESSYQKQFADDEYMIAFLRDVCLRPSCYDCAFKACNRESDFTLADFWGIENILPEMDDDKGTSLLIIHSEKGKRLFDEIKDGLCFAEVNLEEALQYNPSMVRSAKPNPKRKAFFENLDSCEFHVLVRKYCVDSPFKMRIKRIVGRFKCTFSINTLSAIYRRIRAIFDVCQNHESVEKNGKV